MNLYALGTRAHTLQDYINNQLAERSSLFDAMEAEGLGTELEDVPTWPQWAMEQHSRQQSCLEIARRDLDDEVNGY